MRTRPPEYYYWQGWALIAVAVFAAGLGVARLEWEYLVGTLCFFSIGILYLGYLAWWRRNYDEGHPGDTDTEITFLERHSDTLSMGILRFARRAFVR
jgi:hypothetical protein